MRFLIVMLLPFTLIDAKEGFCRRCDEIREHNKKHHKNYEYYDDFLNDKDDSSCESKEKPKSKEKKK